jgi:hypothetical protein
MQALVHRAGLALALLLLAPAAEAATIVTLDVDVLRSTLTFENGDEVALSGSIVLTIGALPVGASNTTFDVVDLQLQGSVSVTLDGTVANPGLGVLSPSGRFLVPTLFLDLHDLGGPLAVSDVVGDVTFGPGGASIQQLEVAVDFLSDEAGLVRASLVFVPEPATIALVASALGVLGWMRAQREGAR